jgi:hypothetical protein
MILPLTIIVVESIWWHRATFPRGHYCTCQVGMTSGPESSIGWIDEEVISVMMIRTGYHRHNHHLERWIVLHRPSSHLLATADVPVEERMVTTYSRRGFDIDIGGDYDDYFLFVVDW